MVSSKDVIRRDDGQKKEIGMLEVVSMSDANERTCIRAGCTNICHHLEEFALPRSAERVKPIIPTPNVCNSELHV